MLWTHEVDLSLGDLRQPREWPFSGDPVRRAEDYRVTREGSVMKHLLWCVSVAALACVAPAGVGAQASSLQLTMKDGRVTIVARDVPLRDLLEEWSRVGQTRIVNVDKLAGPRLTLQLVNTTERDALDILLRSAAGYIAAPRPADRPGTSAYDRITILASSRPPAVTVSAAQAPQPVLAPPVAVNDGNDEGGVMGSQQGAQENPAQRSAVAPFPGLQPQLEGAQPRDIDLKSLMEDPQGQTIAPVSSPRPGEVPGQTPRNRNPYQRRPGRGGGD
jgi:hypothetical protein